MAATSRRARLLRRPPSLLDRSAQDGAHTDKTGLPAEVCERMRRDANRNPLTIPIRVKTLEGSPPLRPCADAQARERQAAERAGCDGEYGEQKHGGLLHAVPQFGWSDSTV
jgi:hypothetical protein